MRTNRKILNRPIASGAPRRERQPVRNRPITSNELQESIERRETAAIADEAAAAITHKALHVVKSYTACDIKDLERKIKQLKIETLADSKAQGEMFLFPWENYDDQTIDFVLDLVEFVDDHSNFFELGVNEDFVETRKQYYEEMGEPDDHDALWVLGTRDTLFYKAQGNYFFWTNPEIQFDNPGNLRQAIARRDLASEMLSSLIQEKERRAWRFQEYGRLRTERNLAEGRKSKLKVSCVKQTNRKHRFADSQTKRKNNSKTKRTKYRSSESKKTKRKRKI